MRMCVKLGRVDDAALVATALPYWQARAAAMSVPKAQQRELAVGGLLAQLLAEWGVPRTAVVATQAQGKPYLPAYPQVHFNVSHSHDVVMAMVAQVPCGCDVERVGRYDPAVAQRALTPAEFAQVEALPTELRAAEFVRLWTLKEAFLKALGVGLQRDPASFAAADTPAEPYPAPTNYAAAICLLSETASSVP